MLPPAPPTPDVHVALLDLASGVLHPLSGDWLYLGWTPGQPVPLEQWLHLAQPGDRLRLERELERAPRLGDAVTRQVSFGLRPLAPGSRLEAVCVEADWQVARRAQNGQATHLSVALRLLPGGQAGSVRAPTPLTGLPPGAGLLGGASDTATFTWTQGAPGLPALQASPALAEWLGEAPTTLDALLAHLDPQSACAVQTYLHGQDPAAPLERPPLERLGELRSVAGAATSPGTPDVTVRPVLLSVQPPIRIAGARVAYGTLRDVGEAFRLHEALADRERLLGEAQALARLGSWRFDLRRGTLVWTDGVFHLLGLPPGTPDIATWLAHTHPEDRSAVQAALAGDWSGTRLSLRHRILRADGEERVVETRGRAEVGPDGQPALLYGTTQDVTGQVRAETQEREARRLQAALLDAAAAVTATLDRDEVLARLVGSVGRMVPFDEANILLLEPGGETLRIVLRQLGPDAPARAHQTPTTFPLSSFPLLVSAAARGSATVVEDVRRSALWVDLPHSRWIRSVLLQPILVEGKLLGFLKLLSAAPGAFTAEGAERVRLFMGYVRAALHNARLFQETQQRLARLEALHDLDTVISTAHDLGHVMGRVAEIAAAQPGVSAVTVCLRSPHAPLLEYVARQGLCGPVSGAAVLSDEGPPAMVALEGRPLRVPDVKASSLLGPGAWPRRTGARGYQALPLSAKGQVLGVLEYAWQAEEPDPQTQVFLRVLADQAAIASESARLYCDLQRQSAHLALAYDETLEGWSRALDLRDKETEGHTRRVTDLTVRLAQAFGIDPEVLTHIRRGALLHDIGKMGIPDAILHKPGPLDADEWAVMKRHPCLALELLSPIGFLRPALDIPSTHHEKWDGSGYPRGLRGDAIPLSARLFAVVDVWDALTNDRPYRPAWTPERALAHIRAESGHHFDPQVVEVFTALIVERHPQLAGVLNQGG